MCSEIECAVCYRTYNPGRRCPRELRCGHSFCESCLRALSRPLGADQAAGRSITCPLCRQPTPISREGTIRAELRVDECALGRLMDSGLLDAQEEEEVEEEEGATAPESPAEESDSSPGTRSGGVRRSWKKVWRTIVGKSRREDCMTDDDLRNLAMMSCYMF